MITGGISNLDLRGSSLIEEVGKLNEFTQVFGEDMSEVRRYLALPTRDYSSIFNIEIFEESDGDPKQIALFRYVGHLASNERLRIELFKNHAALLAFGEDEALLKYIEEGGLVLGSLKDTDEKYSLAISNTDKKTLVEFYVDKETGLLYRHTISETEKVELDPEDTLVEMALEYLADELETIYATISVIDQKKAHILSVMESEELKTLLASNRLSFDVDPVKEDFLRTYSIRNEAGEEVAQIILDKETQDFILKDLRDAEDVTHTATDLKVSLPPFIERLDILPSAQRNVVEAKELIEETFDDAGFKLLLKDADMLVETEPREDAYRLYYDLKSFGDEILGSIVIEKSTGVISVVDPNGANTVNLLMFEPDSKKKTLELPNSIPTYSKTPVSKAGAFNILVAGKHGSMLDTIIFVHLDENSQSIDMISIPRDLYYNGRKINHYASMYGMDEFAKVVGEISGHKVDRYVLIDMYAFIDVVNIIGGIDIHLDRAVIDPTYKTIDDGVEGTLHYEAGDYHMNGTQALRLARTRHTSSDFARSERQQMILAAIQEKARSLGFGDAGMVYDIVKTVIQKTDTNISLQDAVSFYYKYQGYSIDSMSVMSTGNILEVPEYITKEDCAANIAAAQAAGETKPGCEDQLQAYTLLPKNDDWDLIKWFFRQRF